MGKPLRILLLEDSPLDVELTTAALKEGGVECEIVLVDRWGRFVEALAQGGVDLILANYSLPDLNGAHALELVRAHSPELPFIFVSAMIGEERAIAAMKEGATDYVLKNQLERLVPAVRRAIEEARRRAEQRRGEAALRESEARFRAMADTAPVLIWMSGADQRCDYFNKVWLEFTGRTAEQEPGQGWAEGIHPEDLARCLETYTTSFEARRDFKMEYRRRRADGEYRWILDVGTPRLTPGGELLGYIGSCVDITERKQAEAERARLLAGERAARQQAEAANRIKDEFLATVSHELRTPLNAVLGWTQLLRMGQLDEETAGRALETIERSARSQAQIIEDILDVSRIITGKLRLDVCAVEILPVIEAAVASVQPAAEAKGIHLRTVLDPLAGPVSGDPDRLQQVIWNLLANAIKFTPKGGRVEVRLERVASHAEITVTDTGQGISPEFLPFVFDRFRQADSSSTRLHGGLGLGLAIVRHLTELHGGMVSADSPGPGQGATFTISLPLRPVQARGAEPEPEDALHIPSSAMLKGVRVLVVDDKSDARTLLRTILEQSGAEVTAAATAAEALQILSASWPDVLLSDIEMPGEDGYALIRKARALAAERGRPLPAAALTAYARAEDRQRALLAGFQIHVAKPVDPSELLTVVATLAGRVGER